LETLLRLQKIEAVSIIKSIPEAHPIPVFYDCELNKDEFSVLMGKFYKNIGEDTVIYKVSNMHFRDILTLITDAAETLRRIHASDILHGDVSSENMMFTSEEFSRIGYVDFGLSRKKDSKLKLGTFLYMSPEIKLQENFDAEKNEIWSFGTSICVMLFNRWIVSNNKYGDIVWESVKKPKKSVLKYVEAINENFEELSENKRTCWEAQCGKKGFEAFKASFLGIFKIESDRSTLDDFITSMVAAIGFCPHIQKAEQNCCSMQLI
jgi:serine/threonine protein kinase